jgi:hypothetical protein
VLDSPSKVTENDSRQNGGSADPSSGASAMAWGIVAGCVVVVLAVISLFVWRWMADRVPELKETELFMELETEEYVTMYHTMQGVNEAIFEDGIDES